MERPAYLELHRRGELLERLQESLQTMKNCSLCPRRCQVDRTRGETGFCRTGARARVASFHAHFGEEATLVGSRGSGTIFMGSCKFWDNAMAREYCQAPDYRERARAAILEMHRQVGDLEIDRQGIARRGLLIRHLIMPANVAGTVEILDFIATEVSRETYVNLMDQYRPCGEARKDPQINRLPSREEISAALDAARKAGLVSTGIADRIGCAARSDDPGYFCPR